MGLDFCRWVVLRDAAVPPLQSFTLMNDGDHEPRHDGDLFDLLVARLSSDEPLSDRRKLGTAGELCGLPAVLVERERERERRGA